MNRWPGAEIYLTHFGHGLLYLVVLAIVAAHVPWWALLAGWEEMMTTTTTAPRGDEAARQDAGKIEDHEEMRGNRWLT